MGLRSGGARVQEGERRLRPDARTSALLIAVLQALTRLASCPQLQEEVCALRLFSSIFSLLDCGCDRVAMEAARLLARLWAPEAFNHGSKPFVNKTAGEEYRFNKPEDAIQVHLPAASPDQHPLPAERPHATPYGKSTPARAAEDAGAMQPRLSLPARTHGRVGVSGGSGAPA